METEKDLIKRVVGLPGETVEARDGHVLVNGQPLDEPYLPDGVETAPSGPSPSPPDHYWVMGDNRPELERQPGVRPDRQVPDHRAGLHQGLAPRLVPVLLLCRSDPADEPLTGPSRRRSPTRPCGDGAARGEPRPSRGRRVGPVAAR